MLVLYSISEVYCNRGLFCKVLYKWCTELDGAILFVSQELAKVHFQAIVFVSMS